VTAPGDYSYIQRKLLSESGIFLDNDDLVLPDCFEPKEFSWNLKGTYPAIMPFFLNPRLRILFGQFKCQPHEECRETPGYEKKYGSPHLSLII
jgi:hypothetical protein